MLHPYAKSYTATNIEKKKKSKIRSNISNRKSRPGEWTGYCFCWEQILTPDALSPTKSKAQLSEQLDCAWITPHFSMVTVPALTTGSISACFVWKQRSDCLWRLQRSVSLHPVATPWQMDARKLPLSHVYITDTLFKSTHSSSSAQICYCQCQCCDFDLYLDMLRWVTGNFKRHIIIPLTKT